MNLDDENRLNSFIVHLPHRLLAALLTLHMTMKTNASNLNMLKLTILKFFYHTARKR